MESIALSFFVIAFVMYMNLSARVTKMERMLKRSGIGIEKSESLSGVLDKNIGRNGTLTYCNGASLIGDKKVICTILDVDEEWVLLEESKKKDQQLLHIDSIRSVQF